MDENLANSKSNTTSINSKPPISIQQWIQDILDESYIDVDDNGMQTPAAKLKSSEVSLSMQQFEVIVLGFEVIKMTDFISSVVTDGALSTLLRLKTHFTIYDGLDTTEKYDYFIVKSPPDQEEDRDMASLAKVDMREVHFYTEVIPYMKYWIATQNVKIFLPFAKCYFGKVFRPLGKKAMKDIEANFPYAESVIVLEDLAAHGYSKRNYTQGLTIDEVKATVFELAKIHSISWIIQEQGFDEGPLFKFALKPLEIAVLYDILLGGGMQSLKKFLATQDNGSIILRHIVNVEAKLRGTLVALMEPSISPAPTTLTHMNCWADNLMFRPRCFENTDSELDESETRSKIKRSNLECRILDWQFVGKGRPTHDLALLVVTSMSPLDRQNYTDIILKYYFQIFEDTASLFGQPLSFDLNCIRQEYKTSKLLAVFFVIGFIDLALLETSTQERLLAILEELIQEDLI